MEKGAQVWAVDRDGDDAWILCEVLSKTDTELKLQQIDKDSNVFARSRVDAKPAAGANDEVTETRYEGVELANAKLSEADRAEGRDDDLITLPHLHEPAILHAIHERFTFGKIYTWTGPVLIAVNPFQRLPLYTNVSVTVPQMTGSYFRATSSDLGQNKICFFLINAIPFTSVIFSSYLANNIRKSSRATARRAYFDLRTSEIRRASSLSPTCTLLQTGRTVR